MCDKYKERLEFFVKNPVNVKELEIINCELNVRSSRSKKYWLARGFSEIDSIILSKSRMPGQYEYYRIFKQLDHEISKQEVEKYSKNVAVTLENMIKKHGKIKGLEKWESYCERQAKTNSYDYKKKHHGWSKEKFNDYNKSRAVTLENMIKKHGKIKGLEKWESYCERQCYTNTEHYFIEKYGKKKGKEKYLQVNKQKSHTLESFIERYDDYDIGKEKYIEYMENRLPTSFRSQKADDFFMKLVFKNNIQHENHLYVGCINKEYGVFLETSKRYSFVDFYYNGRIIEYYGNYWHANPKLYKENYIIHYPSNVSVLAKNVRDKDNCRINELLDIERILDIMVIWESDHDENEEELLDRCSKFINGEIHGCRNR